MSKWPKINFVDEMPHHALVEIKDLFQQRNIIPEANQKTLGYINYDRNEIYVVKRCQSRRVLVHELCHWLINELTETRWPHKLIDRVRFPFLKKKVRLTNETLQT